MKVDKNLLRSHISSMPCRQSSDVLSLVFSGEDSSCVGFDMCTVVVYIAMLHSKDFLGLSVTEHAPTSVLLCLDRSRVSCFCPGSGRFIGFHKTFSVFGKVGIGYKSHLLSLQTSL